MGNGNEAEENVVDPIATVFGDENSSYGSSY